MQEETKRLRADIELLRAQNEKTVDELREKIGDLTSQKIKILLYIKSEKKKFKDQNARLQDENARLIDPNRKLYSCNALEVELRKELQRSSARIQEELQVLSAKCDKIQAAKDSAYASAYANFFCDRKMVDAASQCDSDEEIGRLGIASR